VKIPAYLIMRDLLTWPKAMAEQCTRLGFDPVVLVDNGSTYPPLLEWYSRCPYEVIRLENHGHTGFWAVGLDKQQKGYYVVSDPDLDLSRVPDDLIPVMVAAYERHQHITKVGLSLEIEDLPDEFPLKRAVRNQEAFYWHFPSADGHWHAEVDTTFALYGNKKWGKNFYQAVRLNRPYTARHLPWYRHPGNVTDEELYYLRNAATPTHWTRWARLLLRPLVRESELTPPSPACPHPELWHAYGPEECEAEVVPLAGALVRALQPDVVVQTQSGLGYAAQAMAAALQRNGHGRLYCFDPDEARREATGVQVDQLPAEPAGADVADREFPEGVQLALVGAAAPGEQVRQLLHLRRFLRGVAVIQGCPEGGPVERWLGEGGYRFARLPTPRGLLVVEVPPCAT
jgi:hypothetical protein